MLEGGLNTGRSAHCTDGNPLPIGKCTRPLTTAPTLLLPPRRRAGSSSVGSSNTICARRAALPPPCNALGIARGVHISGGRVREARARRASCLPPHRQRGAPAGAGSHPTNCPTARCTSNAARGSVAGARQSLSRGAGRRRAVWRPNGAALSHRIPTPIARDPTSDPRAQKEQKPIAEGGSGHLARERDAPQMSLAPENRKVSVLGSANGDGLGLPHLISSAMLQAGSAR